MKITKTQLRKMIQEAIAEEGEEYEVKIGKPYKDRIQSTVITVKATSRDDAKRKALQHPTFKKDNYEYAMFAAPGSLEDYI